MRTVSLSEIATSIVDGPFGSSLKTSDYVEDGIPVLQGKNITGDKFIWKDVRFITEQKAKELKRSACEKGDHLLVKIGSIGYSAILDDLKHYDHAIIPANLARIRPNRNIIDDRYLHNWLRSNEAKSYFTGIASKTAQPALSLAKIKDARLPLPPLDEQRRIAAVLDNADALRQKRKQAFELFDELAHSIFLDLFGDPVTNPKNWEVVTLGDFEKFLTSGSRGWAQYYSDVGRGFIRIGNLRGGEVDTRDLIYVAAPNNAEARRTLVEEGDLLISITADLGRVAVVPQNLDKSAHINQHIALVRLKSINPYFAAHYLASAGGQRQFEALNRQGVKAGLNFENIRSLEMLNPPRNIQDKFARAMAQLRSKRRDLEMGVRAMSDLLTSLQYRAFTLGL